MDEQPRLSRSGDLVAFAEHPLPGDARGGMVVMGKDGQRRTLASRFTACCGTSWSPSGDEETRTLEPGPVVRYSRAVWDPGGRRVVFSGFDEQDVERVYLQDAGGGPPRTVTTDDVGLPRLGRPVSPGGRRVVALGPDGLPALYPLAGGNPVALPGVGEDDLPICSTPDGRELWVARYEEDTPRIERVDITSGRARPWDRLGRSAPSGLSGQFRVLVTPDGESSPLQ